MRPEALHRIGEPSLEKLGIAPNMAELGHMAEGYSGHREVGRRRVSLWQCPCLRWNRQGAQSCGACGRSPDAAMEAV